MEVEETYLVGTAVPFASITVEGTKPVPVRVTDVVAPAGTIPGFDAVRAGTGKTMLTGYLAVIAALEASVA
jgi:hypothetical protein